MLDPHVNNDESVVMGWSGPRPIRGSRYSEFSDNNNINLTISPLADQDDGTYTCSVTVTGGSDVWPAYASSDVTLSVNGNIVCLL